MPSEKKIEAAAKAIYANAKNTDARDIARIALTAAEQAEPAPAALEATPAPMVTEAKVEAALKAFHSAGRYASEKARMKAALTAAQESGR